MQPEPAPQWTPEQGRRYELLRKTITIYVGNVRKHGIPPTKMPTGPMPGWVPPLPKLPTPADITKPFEDMGKLVLLALVLLAVSKADRG